MSGSLNEISLVPGTYFSVEKIALKKESPAIVYEHRKSKALYLKEKEIINSRSILEDKARQFGGSQVLQSNVASV